MKALIGLVIALFAISDALAFDEDGYRSEMTTAQLEQSLAPQGLIVWQTTSGYFALRLGADQKPDMNGPFVSISFCDSKLGSVIHALDFDTQYIPSLERLEKKYGNPQKVDTRSILVSGTDAVYVSTVETVWYHDADRIILSFSPEMRKGDGTLRFKRQANITYASKNKCWTGDW
jgi:hypothetical protein